MSNKPRVLVVEDDDNLRNALAYNFEYTGFEVITVESAEEAINCVTEVPKQGEFLDVVTSDILLPGKSGLEFLRLLRNLPDESLFASGLRVRYLPFVILSAAGSRNRAVIIEIDRNVPIIDKPFSMDELLKTVSSAIGNYRHAILSELQFSGMGISWQDGRFQVVSAYTIPPSIESKYFDGRVPCLSRAYQRTVLITNRSSMMRVTIDAFEEMLNKRETDERDIHSFIERHPSLLLGEDYDSYWSEPRLFEISGKPLQPDFVLQPFARRMQPWKWAVVDLKRPDAAVLASKRFHPDFSKKVYHLATQLRDYGEYFADPRNAEGLKRIFGGIVPQPKLVGVIGRRPQMTDIFGKLLARIPDVTILSYDDVLEFRRARVDHLAAVGF